MSPATVVLVLACLLGLQPITTDLYLPALPALTDALRGSMGQAQLTLAALLLAFGTSQLVWGPLSDRFGRKPILLIGVAAYTLAGIGCVVAESMSQLIVWRVLQGVAMGAGVMAARAVVRDVYIPAEGARVMSKGLSGLGVLACIAAPLGGWLTELWGWRATMAALATYGALVLVLIWLRFEETVPPAQRRPLDGRSLLSAWQQILSHRTFWAYSLLATTSYAGLFTFLASSSFVFTRVLGLSKTQYGGLMFIMALSYLTGTFLCRRLLSRWGVKRTVAVAAGLTLTGGLTMTALAHAAGGPTGMGVWGIMVPYCIFMLAHGVHQPCGQSGAVGPFPQAAGTASALNGFCMMVAAFGMGAWLGSHMDHSVFPLTDGIAFWAVCIAVVAWWPVRKHG